MAKPGPPPDNPTEDTAKALAAAARDAERFKKLRDELVIKALDEGGSTRRVAWLANMNESSVRHIMKRDGTDELRRKISARDNKNRERQDYWPFKSKAEYEAFMKRRGG